MSRNRRSRNRRQQAAQPTPAAAQYSTARELGAATLRASEAPDGGTEFRRVADGAIFKVVARGPKDGYATVIRNITADPLDWYIHRSLISDDQYSAGRVMQSAYYDAVGSGVLSVQYDGVHGVASHKGFNPSQRRWDAMLAYIDALNRVRFPARGVLVAVVSFGWYANEAARRYGQPAVEGIGVLRDALDDLCRHYRPVLGLRALREIGER